MRHANARLYASWILLVGACGSSAGGTQPPEAPQSSGAEQSAPVPEPAEPVAAPSPEPEPSAPAGPAKIAIDARVRGQSVAADVRVISAGGEEVAHGSTGTALQLTSGQYELQITITDAGAMADKPTQQRTLTLSRGDDLHEKVDFPWAMIQLNVIVNGTPDKAAVVHLSRQGTEVAVLKSGAEPVPLSPGHYSAQVKTHGASIEVPALMFPEGATQSVPVRVQM